LLLGAQASSPALDASRQMKLDGRFNTGEEPFK